MFLKARILTIPCLALLCAPLIAQENVLEDWPCVQRFVPEILPASYWPIPISDDILGSWRRDPITASLARRLGELESIDDAAIEAIDEFVEGIPEAEREIALTRLADGVVDVADERRARYLDGIRRYTRQQMAIAGQIEATLNLLADLDDAERMSAQEGETSLDEGGSDATISDASSRADIEQTLAWHERLYDQRERAIRSLCERPVELEQDVSAMLRELSYRLPGG